MIVTRIAMLCCCAALLASCAGTPAGVEPVSGFEVQRYLGTWYEIARLDHPFERGLERITATYELRDDGGLRVINRGYDVAGDEWREAIGKAHFVGSPDIGRLKVSFFGPFYGGYNIISLDQERYDWVMICGPSTAYLWILSRQPELSQEVLDRLRELAQGYGFDTRQLIFVEHRPAGAAP
jgi:apolipoprotein D and lipocalin family protein